MSSNGKLWRVVGGSQQGGIIVRQGQALNAAKEPQRLATGAVVEQRELVQERLSYRKLAGAGPENGWVSTRLKTCDLLVRVPDSEVRLAHAESCAEEPVINAENQVAQSNAEVADVHQEEAAFKTQEAGPDLPAEQAKPAEEVDDVSESLRALIGPTVVAEKPDLGELSQSSTASDFDRPDRINRGNHWFDFDEMSTNGDESEAEQEPHQLAETPSRSEEASVERVEENVEDRVPCPSEFATTEREEEKVHEGVEEVAEHMQRAIDLASTVQPLLDEPVLCSDSDGMARGRCLACAKCDACCLDHRPYLCWAGSPLDWGGHEENLSYRTGDRVEVRDKLGEDWMPGLVVASQPSISVRPDHWNTHQRSFDFVRRARAADAPKFAERCQRCGCASTEHEKLWEWKMHTELSLARFRNTGKNTKKKIPERSRVPIAALQWSYDDVAIFVLTSGVFDPRCHGRDASPQLDQESSANPEPDSSNSNLLVSVITPTSDKRHVFHPLLYRAFCNQTYEPKELVVVDTGDSPSAFLQERAREDSRLVYRWFNVKDSRQQNLAECLIEPPADNIHNRGMGFGKGKGKSLGFQNTPLRRSQMHLNGKVRGGTRVEGWTLGMKRNLACHLARGAIIAHFDDDDLYAQRYLEVMVSKLCEAAGYHGHIWQSKVLPAAAATLQDWHVFDLVDATFGFVAPLTDPLVEEHMREPYAYGFGFSYLYTRAAWELVMFADVEWSEDGHFVQELRASSKAVALVKSQGVKGCDALAAHSYHSDTTSGGEFIDFQVNTGLARRAVTRSVRMGQKVQPPVSLQGLLPLAFQVVKQAGLKKGAVHPLRQQLSELPVGPEVSLDEKQFFMRTDVGREISFAVSGARRTPVATNFNQHRWRPPQQFMKGAGRGVAWGERSAVRKPPGVGTGRTAFANVF